MSKPASFANVSQKHNGTSYSSASHQSNLTQSIMTPTKPTHANQTILQNSTRLAYDSLDTSKSSNLGVDKSSTLGLADDNGQQLGTEFDHYIEPASHSHDTRSRPMGWLLGWVPSLNKLMSPTVMSPPTQTSTTHGKHTDSREYERVQDNNGDYINKHPHCVSNIEGSDHNTEVIEDVDEELLRIHSFTGLITLM